MELAHNYIYELGLILSVCAFVSILLKIIKLPAFIAFIATGWFLGPNFSFLPTITNEAIIKMWAELGIIFVFFNLGLELNLKKIIQMGAQSFLLALLEVTACFYAGYLFGNLFGLGPIQATFLGATTSISSTTVVLKSLEEYNLRNQSFSNMSLGILIFEDILAMAILILLTAYGATQQFSGGALSIAIIKMLLFITLSLVVGTFIIPTIFKKLIKFLNPEVIIINTSGLAIMMALLASEYGLSSALGAFVMGIIVSSSTILKVTKELVSPLKNIFTAIFFVSVGMMVQPLKSLNDFVFVATLTFCIMLFKLFFVFISSILVGIRFQDSLKSALTLTQIGEFAFIIASLGHTYNILSSTLVSNIILAAILTNILSPFAIKYSEILTLNIEKLLPFKILDFFKKYASSTIFINSEIESRKNLTSYIFHMLINTSIIIGITISIYKISPKYIKKFFNNTEYENIIIFGLTLISCVPFYWSLLGGKVIENIKYFKSTNTVLVNYILNSVRFLTICLLITIQLSLFISSKMTPLVITVAIFFYLTRRLSQKIGSFYSWLERGFVRNLEQNEEDTPSLQMDKMQNEYVSQKRLLIDTTHLENRLAYARIHPNSSIVGKSLKILRVKERYQVNIVMIQRGDKVIIPRGKTKLLPHDEIGFMGEQVAIERWEARLERAEQKIKRKEDALSIKDFELFMIAITEDSIFHGKTIRNLFSGRKLKLRLVALIRDGKEMRFPYADLDLKTLDVCWFVGEKRELNKLLKTQLEEVSEKVEASSV